MPWFSLTGYSILLTFWDYPQSLVLQKMCEGHMRIQTPTQEAFGITWTPKLHKTMAQHLSKKPNTTGCCFTNFGNSRGPVSWLLLALSCPKPKPNRALGCICGMGWTRCRPHLSDPTGAALSILVESSKATFNYQDHHTHRLTIASASSSVIRSCTSHGYGNQ